MSLEVETEACRETGASEARAELLEHCATLPVGDPVKVQEGLVGIGHGARDRMRCWRVVFNQRPTFELHVELLPGGGVLRPFSKAEGGRIGGEGLIKPKIVPPAHRDQVAEPHVRDLVEDNFGEIGQVAWRWRAQEDVALGVGDQTDVLHCTDVELGAVDVVQLLEWILAAEEFAEVGEGLARHLLEEVVRKVLLQRSA